jgi:hypothetical protein
MRIPLRQFCFQVSILIALQTLSFAQQPGTNVDVLPSYPNSASPTQTFYPFPPGPPAITLTDALRGDGYLQRQVEPVVAPSSYNPDHLLAAFGDYRTVSLPGSTGATVTSEGWIGLSRSYDRGHTWFGSLVPGFPQDTSSVGKASPLFGLQAGSDAILATTPGGHFYLGGLFFTRGGISNVAVVHYRDIPNTDGGDTIQYQGAVIVDKGSQSDTGNFEDKPSIAGDIARGTTDPSVCGPVYMAYTIFVGGTAGVFTSKIGFVSSAQGNCGSAFTHQQYLNKTFKQNQGTAMAVDPTTGKIYVVWRHIFVPGGDGFPDAIVMATSTNGGATFSSPVIITSSTFAPFDQFSVATTTDSKNPTFRSTAYPTITVDGKSNVYMAIQERTFPSSPSNYPPGYYSPRIILRTLRRGQSTWTRGSIVDSGVSGNSGTNPDAQQVMPTLSFAAGQLRLMWYDFRDQNQVSTNVGGGWFISGFDRQTQTYVAQSSLSGNDANGNPVFNPSVPVTQYLSDVKTKQVPTVGNAGKDPAVNRPNLPMYVGGTMPFTGDYIWLMSANPFVANPGGKSAFRWATEPSDYIALDSYGVWADSRDVIFPTFDTGVPDLHDSRGWTEYSPPGTGLSCINGGARNENVYFSEIKPGIVAGSPATSRQLVDGNGQPIERAFPIYVQNPTSQQYNYQFTFAPGPGPTVNGSFVQGTEITGPATTTITLPVVPYSSATVTVYANCPACTSSTAIAPFSVGIIEQDPVSGSPVATTSVFFNNDPTSPFVTNTQVEPLSNGEVHNASVSNPQWANPQWANPQWANPQWANPQWANPQWANVAPDGASTPVGDLVWTVTNAGNNASAYTSIINVATSGLAVATGGNTYLYQIIVSRAYNFPGFSSCGSQPIPQDQIISIIPSVDFSNPQWANPQWANLDWENPQWANATFAASPPPAGATSAPSALSSTMSDGTNAAATTADDGTIKMPLQTDHVFVVLRIYRMGAPSCFSATSCLSPTEQAAFLANVSQVIVAQAANTGSTIPTSTSNKRFTSTTLVSSATPSVYGQAVTFTAHVSPTSGTGTPTGTVDFKDGTTLLQTVPVTSGVASFSYSTLAAGVHTITAFYSGDPNFNGGMSNSLTQTVTAAATTTTLLSNLNPSIAGQTVNFTATVAPVSPSAATPSGIVNIVDCINVGGGMGCGQVGSGTLTNGQVTVPVSTLTPGPHTITAVYQGTSNFTGSTSNAVSQFIQALTSTGVSVSPTPSALNQLVTLTATVTPVGVSGTPTGTVTFVVDNVAQPSASLINGIASVPYTFTTNGAHSVMANYSGDATFAGSFSTFSQPVQSPRFSDFSALANCGYSAIPAQPILSYTSGGTTTGPSPDNVRVSFLNGTAEGGASGVSSILVPDHNLLMVNSPGAASGATGWNVYVNNILQNSTPIAIGTSWTEPASGLISQGKVPSGPTINPSNAPGCLQTNSGVGDGGVSVGPLTYANTVLNSGADALELTQEISSQDSSAWFNVLQPVKNGFTTTFTFQISDPQSLAASGSLLADGIAFVIHNSSSGLSAIGGSGGSIGYGPSSQGSNDGTPVTISGSVDNSVVVEFDTYDNTPFNGDPNGNHVAVQSCGPGRQNSNAHDSPGSNDQSGFPNCVLAINSDLVTFSDGTMHTVTINYLPPGAALNGSCSNAQTGELDVTLDTTSVFSACMTIESQINLAGASADSAYVGFTSATGFYDEEADILSWNFTPTAPVIIE